MTATSQTNFLNTTQLADRLTNRKNTIEGWRVKGIGPRYVKIGRLVRYRIEDVEAWLEKQTRSSTSQAGC